MVHGATLKIEASSSNDKQFYGRLHVYSSISAPEGVSLQLSDDSLIIRELDTENSWLIKIDNIQLYRNGAYVDLPPTSIAYGQTDFYKVLGGRKRYFDSGLSFSVSSGEIPKFLREFTVQFPLFIINGQEMLLKPIQFKHVKDLGVAPLNC